MYLEYQGGSFQANLLTICTGGRRLKENIASRVEALAAPVAEGLGYQLFDVEYVKEGPDFYLRLYITKEDGIYLQITLPEEFFDLNTQLINTELLGCTRLTEEYYENPDGSALTINHDLLGNELNTTPIAGPLQGLKAGINEIKIYNALESGK